MNKVKFFKAIIAMPEFSIKKGDVITRDNTSGRYSISDGTILPTYLKLDSCVMLPITQTLNIGDVITVDENRIPKGYSKGLYKVVDYYPKQEKYLVSALHGDTRFTLNGNDIKLSEKYLKKAEVYYFLDSKGIIQMTYTGKDKSADDWRTISYNIYKTKEDAQKHKEALVAGYAACLR